MNPDFAWVFRNSITNRLQAQGLAAYAIQHLAGAALRRPLSGGARRDRT